MNSRVSLLAIIVALCLGHVVSRGIETEQNITFSANLEVYDPWGDCVGQLSESDNLTDCDDNLFVTKTATLEKVGYVSYLMEIEIGSDKQEFKVGIDTGSSTTWVFDENCKDTDVPCRGHRKYKSGSSGTYREIAKRIVKNYGPVKTEGYVARDTIYLANGFEAKKQLFGAMTKTSQVVPFDGLLALGVKKTAGYPPVFIKAATEAGMEPIFSLNLKGGGSSADGGEIMFGGLNKDLFNAKSKLAVKIISDAKYLIQMDEAKFGDLELCKKGGKVTCKAYIDSGCSRIIGPKAVIDPFNKNVLKATGNGAVGEVRCSDVPSFPSLDITFGDQTLVLESIYYIRKVGLKCFTVLFGHDDLWLFGSPFFVKFYTSFDLKDATITFHTKK